MSSNIVNQVTYLRTTREFPQDAQSLATELNKAYIDTANVVNSRTIGIFPVNQPAISGETWFTAGTNQKQQGLRRVYPFTAATLTQAHGIIISQISGFVRIWGTFVDAGGVWYPLPFVSTVAAANQVSVQVNATNIVITVGAGAPAPVSGFVILEWLSNP
jgi:hypothetical protein